MCSTEIAKFFTVGSVVKPCTRSAHAHKRSRAAFHLIRGRVPRHVSACPALHHPPTFQPSNLYNALCLHSKIRPSVPDKNRGFSNGWCGPFTTFPPLVNIQLDLLTFLTRPTLHVQSISTPRSDVTSSSSPRTTKYLKKASLTRTCAIGGFFLSIPLFLIGKCSLSGER